MPEALLLPETVPGLGINLRASRRGRRERGGVFDLGMGVGRVDALVLTYLGAGLRFDFEGIDRSCNNSNVGKRLTLSTLL